MRPCVPASGRSQYSTRFRPGKPTIAVPVIVTGVPTRMSSGGPSM